MDVIQALLDNDTAPALTAFLLGLMTAISPCPLATNITAIGYLSKEIENRHRVFGNGLLYTLGRVITYTLLGFILIPIIRKGASIFAIENGIATYGEQILPPLLILIGCYMLFGHRLKMPHFGRKTQSHENANIHSSNWGALGLGVIFALAFCPTSGVFYFGVLIPMSAAEANGYWYPLLFAIATALPVIVVAWLLAYSIAGIGRFYNRMRVVQRWLNWLIATLFILAGIYFLLILYW